jgi:hypothetical protein
MTVFPVTLERRVSAEGIDVGATYNSAFVKATDVGLFHRRFAAMAA